MAASSKKVIIAAMAGNTLIALTKFIAAGFTGSSAMLAEGIHSLVDTGNQVLLLYGLKRAKRPADQQFPFGHGKEIYFWCFVVAILIFALGAGISIYEGILHLLDPHPIQTPYINYIVLGLSMLFEGAAWVFALKAFRQVKGDWGYLEAVHRGKDPSIFVVLFEDSAAMLGLVAAFAGILLSQVTGIPHFDGAASIVIGLILGVTAVWLAYETKGLLIGESANRRVSEAIRRIVGESDHVDRVNEVLTMHMGPEFILATISVNFRDDVPVGAIEVSVERMTARIKASDPRIKRVFIEAESRPATREPPRSNGRNEKKP